MSYYQALGLVREPFSNSPDPDMLYRAPSHLECLQHMEIAVRLRRGLNVVLGEVGTGKTTLGRELTRLLSGDDDIEVHFIDDPYHAAPEDFLLALARLFDLDTAPIGRDAGLLREALKNELYRRGQDGRRIVALIVDEGQKITPPCLELLRELLNFETNTHKLLQIVIFAQTEFEAVLAAQPNLDDRVNFRYRLLPLNRIQTRRMIETRLALCSPDGRAPAVFTALAVRRVHRLTGGYPRKIVRLCHLSMLLAVGFGRRRIGWGLVGRAAREQRGVVAVWARRGGLAAGCALAGLIAVGAWQGALPGIGHTADILTRAVASLTATPAGTPVAGQAPAAPEAAPGDEATASTEAPAVPEAASTATVSETVRTAEATAAPEPVVTEAAAPGETRPASEEARQPAPALQAAHGAGQSLGVEAEHAAKAQPAAAPATPAAPASPRQDTGAARGLADNSRPPATAEQVIVVAPEDGLPAAAVTAAAAVTPALPPAMPESEAGLASPPSAPDRLGATVVRPGWTVSQLAARLYGNGGRAVLSRLAAANPGKDFNKVRAGDTLVYPPIEVSPPPLGSYLVKVAEADTLEQGFAVISRYRGRQEFSLFCTRLPDARLRFDVVLPGLYATEAAAGAALAELPRELAAKAALLSGYPAGTTYFTELGAPRRFVPAATRIVASAVRPLSEARPSPLPGQP